MIDGKIEAAKFDFGYLRFLSGKEGLTALERLRDDPRIKAMPDASALVDEALSVKSLYDLQNAHRPQKFQTTEEIRSHLVVYPASTLVPSEFLELFNKTNDLPFGFCMSSVGNCTLVKLDLDGDRSFELALFDSNLQTRAYVFRRDDEGDWRPVATAYLVTESKNAANDLRKGIDGGKVDAVAPDPRWNSLRIGDLRFEIQTYFFEDWAREKSDIKTLPSSKSD